MDFLNNKIKIFSRCIKLVEKNKKNWKDISDKKVSFNIINNDNILNLIGESPVSIAVNELRKKYDSNWRGHYGDPKFLYPYIDSKFVEKSVDVIRSVCKTDSFISVPTAIYIRLMSPAAVMSQETPTKYSTFSKRKSFVSYKRYCKVLENEKTLSKMQAKILYKASESMPVAEILLEQLSPVYTGYIGMIDQVCSGIKIVKKDLLIREDRKKLLLRNMPELSEEHDSDHLTYLLKQTCPTLNDDMHDKAMNVLPCLYVLCIDKWIKPKYSFNDPEENYSSPSKASILDAYYWSGEKETSLVNLLNSLSVEDLKCYMLVAFKHMNNCESDASKALLNAYRAIIPISHRLDSDIIEILKSACATELEKLTTKHDVSSYFNPVLINRLRKGLKAYTNNDFFIRPSDISEHEARKAYKKSVTDKLNSERDKANSRLDRYSKFLQTCLDNNVSPSKELFDKVESGDVSLESISTGKYISGKVYGSDE